MFCKHKWEVVLNEYQPSPIEKMDMSGITEISYGFCVGKRIIILQCSKLDKTIEEC